MKKISQMVVIILCLTMLSSCNLFKKDKDFKCDDLTITLDSTFSKTTQVGVNLALVSKKYVVAITKDTTRSSLSLEEYCNFIANNMAVTLEFEESTNKSGDTFCYAKYDNTGGNDIKYSYLSSIYKYRGIFYIVDIACERDNKSDKVMNQFLSWAKSVNFS